jgi:hypothetical protein
MEITHNHNAKSQLAKLLATENITVQHSASAKTAWFDVKNRVLMLPVWREMSDDLYDMLVVHEVGHALDTPGEDFVENLKAIAARLGETSNRALGAIKGFVNVIEDARIDKRQKRRFPGARRNYIKGYAELIEKDFFGTATKDVNSMSFIDRLNIYCKGGVMLGINFSPEEKVMLRKVEAAETFEEVLALTEEIYRWSKQQMENQQEEENGPDMMKAKTGFGDDSEDGEDGDEFEFGDDEDAESDPSQSSQSMSQDDDGDGDEDGDEDEDERNGSASTEDGEKEDAESDAGTATNGDDVPESETEKAWQEKQNDLVIDSEYDYVYAKLPKIADYDRTVHDFKVVLDDQRAELARRRFDPDWLLAVRKELNQFKSSENSAISFMVKEFEMRKSADEYSRTSTAKTGMLDTNKLHSYRYNDDLFRRITTVASGKNHGFVMFVDWSSSMDTNLRKTVRQLLSLVMFCKRVQIPFEVYAFRCVSYSDNERTRLSAGFTKNTNEICVDSFVARNLLSSRMKIQELNDAMYHLFIMSSRHGGLACDDLTSTPLNPCIVAASEIVNRFKAKSKVQIVNTVFITDGDSDPMSGSINGVNIGWKPRKIIIQDDITKKTYDLPAVKYSSHAFRNDNITPVLLKILKDRTDCNLIGFFINSNGFKRVYDRYHGYGNAAHRGKAATCWKDNGFFGVTSAGYDEYYIINALTFNVSSGNLVVAKDATRRGLASAFIKFSEKKSISRVLLTQVVKRIAA